MIQTPYQLPTLYIHCPVCGKGDKAVGHLTAGTQTRWYCDECGAEFSLEVLPDGRILTEPTGKRKEKTVVTLRAIGIVVLEVQGLRFYPADDDEQKFIDGQRYFYNEHTCPTNYMDRVLKVIDGAGDEDPHGIFEFVSARPWEGKDDL